MSALASAAHRAFAAFGLNLTRLPGNRFDAMPASLARLARVGFAPTRIIDAGANRGQWAQIATCVFPRALLHLIEPQEACRAELDALAVSRGFAEVHAVAVTRPGADRLVMTGATAGSTGAHVLRGSVDRSDGFAVPATTIDALLADELRETDRVLLKLDVEGHELDVLAGAADVLPRVEVIVTEVQFFACDGSDDPMFMEVASAITDLGYVLYDFAALGSSGRDGRLRMGDVVFVRCGSALLAEGRRA
jgi:FkbM family methyltransferase